MDGKQLFLVFLVGLAIGALGLYGAQITGYFKVNVEELEAKATGLAYQSKIYTNIIEETDRKENEIRGRGVSDVAVMPLITKAYDRVRDKDALVVYMLVTKAGKIDKALTAEAFERLNTKFAKQIASGDVIIESKQLDNEVAFGVLTDRAHAALGLSAAQQQEFQIIGAQARMAYFAKEAIKDASIPVNTETGIMFGTVYEKYGPEQLRVKAATTPIMYFDVSKQLVLAGENSRDTMLSNQLALNANHLMLTAEGALTNCNVKTPMAMDFDRLAYKTAERFSEELRGLAPADQLSHLKEAEISVRAARNALQQAFVENTDEQLTGWNMLVQLGVKAPMSGVDEIEFAPLVLGADVVSPAGATCGTCNELAQGKLTAFSQQYTDLHSVLYNGAPISYADAHAALISSAGFAEAFGVSRTAQPYNVPVGSGSPV